MKDTFYGILEYISLLGNSLIVKILTQNKISFMFRPDREHFKITSRERQQEPTYI